MLTPRALLEGKVEQADALPEPGLSRGSGMTLGKRRPHIGRSRIGTDLYAGTWLPTAWCHSGTSGLSSGK
jgi:hypothetical protein